MARGLGDIVKDMVTKKDARDAVRAAFTSLAEDYGGSRKSADGEETLEVVWKRYNQSFWIVFKDDPSRPNDITLLKVYADEPRLDSDDVFAPVPFLVVRGGLFESGGWDASRGNWYVEDVYADLSHRSSFSLIHGKDRATLRFAMEVIERVAYYAMGITEPRRAYDKLSGSES